MGWLYMQKPYEGGKAYLDKQCTWESEQFSSKLLRSACYGMFEYYAAIERTNKATGERVVFALAAMMHYTRDGDWGYKDMGEEMGPNIDNCPASILSLLTPTKYEYANEWRARCAAKHARRKAAACLTAGRVVRYGGHDYRLLDKHKDGSWSVVRVTDYASFNMKRSQLAKAEVLN